MTSAGVIAFVGRDAPAVDYIRRETAGGDSVQRIRQAGRGLLEDLWEVDFAISAHNPVRHYPDGFVVRQVQQLPPRAAREAVVNGVTHRDWLLPDPVHIEHTPGRLVVTSPGGFVDGVTADNIITHPSKPRNRALANLPTRLRVAESEGIGVDRMVGDMVRVGHPRPVIDEYAGPAVRAALLGSRIDDAWIALLGSILPQVAIEDLDVLLLVQRVVTAWWVDGVVAAHLIQRSIPEAEEVLERMETLICAGSKFAVRVNGTPSGSSPAIAINPRAVAVLQAYDHETASRPRVHPSRSSIARAWAGHRGRISSTEFASIVGAQPANVQKILRDLEEEGVLRPSRAHRRGAGFFYLPTALGEEGPP